MLISKAIIESRIELCRKLIAESRTKGNKNIKQLEEVMEYWKKLKNEYYGT